MDGCPNNSCKADVFGYKGIGSVQEFRTFLYYGNKEKRKLAFYWVSGKTMKA